LKTRLKPGGRIVLVSTRWHEDDLAGRLLAEAEKGGDKWTTVILPAIAEENDPLGRKAGEFLWDGDPQYQYGDFCAANTQPSRRLTGRHCISSGQRRSKESISRPNGSSRTTKLLR
jgi:hypothetical protein